MVDKLVQKWVIVRFNSVGGTVYWDGHGFGYFPHRDFVFDSEELAIGCLRGSGRVMVGASVVNIWDFAAGSEKYND